MAVTLSNKVFYTFLLVNALALLVALGFAYDRAGGTPNVPNPGHPLTEIQGAFTGDTDLYSTISTKLCQADGTNCPAGRFLGAGFCDKTYTPPSTGSMMPGSGTTHCYYWGPITCSLAGATATECSITQQSYSVVYPAATLTCTSGTQRNAGSLTLCVT